MTFNTMETWRMETWQMQTLWPLRQDVNRYLTTTTAGDEKETSRVLGDFGRFISNQGMRL